MKNLALISLLFLPGSLLTFDNDVSGQENAAASQENDVADQETAKLKFAMTEDPLAQDGLLNKIGPMQKSLFQVTIKGSKLETEYEIGYQDAQGAISQIRSAGRSGGGSSSSGDGSWMSYFQGATFSGYVSHGLSANHAYMLDRIGTHATKDEFQLAFEELGSPQRTVRIGANPNGNFFVSLRSSELGYLFRFRQEKSGRVLCQEMSKEKVFSATAPSFDQFCLENPEFVQQRLLPVFDFIGAGQPVTRYHPQAKKYVIAQLRPVDQEQMNAFRTAARDMGALSYREREAASKAIEEEFEKWQSVIHVAIDDEEFPAETRTRLQKIFEKKVDDSARRLIDLARESKLATDPEYLIWLMTETADENERKTIAGQLENLTEESFDLDAQKWQQWLVESKNEITDDGANSESPEQTGSPASLLDQTGMLEKFDSNIGQLVQFRVSEGQLVLDRDHWAEPFKAKSISNSVDEIRELMKQRNLPLEWLDAGGKHTLDSTEFPQVLFANLAAAVAAETAKKPNNAVYPVYPREIASRNRYFDSSQVSVQLQMHKPVPGERGNRNYVSGAAKKAAPAATHFQLYFKEIASPKRILEVREWSDKSISITLISDDTGAVVRMMQVSPDDPAYNAERGCWVHAIENGREHLHSAADFLKLKEAHGEYMDTQIMSLFDRIGIKIIEN